MNTQQKIYAFFKKQEDAATRAPYSKVFGRKAVRSNCIWYKWVEDTESFEIYVLPWTANTKTGRSKSASYPVNTNLTACVIHVGKDFITIPYRPNYPWQRHAFFEYAAKLIGGVDIRTAEFHKPVLYLDGKHYDFSSDFEQRNGVTTAKQFTPYTLDEANKIVKELFAILRTTALAYFAMTQEEIKDTVRTNNLYDILSRFALDRKLSTSDFHDIIRWYNSTSKAGMYYSDLKTYIESFVRNTSVRRWIVSYYMNHPKGNDS